LRITHPTFFDYGRCFIQEADIFGVFSAYLSGYKTIKILPDLIQKLYEGYGLTDKASGQISSAGYPKANSQGSQEKSRRINPDF